MKMTKAIVFSITKEVQSQFRCELAQSFVECRLEKHTCCKKYRRGQKKTALALSFVESTLCLNSFNLLSTSFFRLHSVSFLSSRNTSKKSFQSWFQQVSVSFALKAEQVSSQTGQFINKESEAALKSGLVLLNYF